MSTCSDFSGTWTLTLRSYIVVDLMNGGDLRFHISRKTFTEEAVRFWIAQLGCAVRYIHQQGIVHRDIKPDNVLLDSDGQVHLADFVRLLSCTPHRMLTLHRTLHPTSLRTSH
jgi:serine/threonine kinase 32